MQEIDKPHPRQEETATDEIDPCDTEDLIGSHFVDVVGHFVVCF
jgi:hypothetical protein